MELINKLNERHYGYGVSAVEATQPVKVYNAIIIDGGKRYYFKSRKGRIFFERRCDLQNALNYAFQSIRDARSRIDKYTIAKDYPNAVIIEERSMIL